MPGEECGEGKDEARKLDGGEELAKDDGPEGSGHEWREQSEQCGPGDREMADVREPHNVGEKPADQVEPQVATDGSEVDLLRAAFEEQRGQEEGRVRRRWAASQRG